MNKEVLKKYGVWIAAGALVLYLVYKNMKGGSVAPRLLPSVSGSSDASLELERMRQAGALDLKRLELNNNLEAIRLKAANDQYNLQQQALARQRALDAAQRGQTLGLIGQIANSIAGLFKSATGQAPKTAPTPPIGGGQGGARTQPQPPPYYQVPAPNIPGLLGAPPAPDYPTISDYPLSVTDWGEAPQFSSAQMDLDTGASFFDQSWGGDGFYYGYGSDYQGDIYSGIPQVTDTYDPYGGGGNVGIDDFYYGYGGGESYDYAYGGGGGDVYVQSVGDESYYGWGGDE